MMRFLFALLSLPFLLQLSSCSDGDTKSGNDTIPKGDTLSRLNAMIGKDPGNLDLYVSRSKVLMDQKSYAAALADMDHVIGIDSSKSQYLLAAADINFFTGRVKRTQQLLERAVEVNPKDVDCKLRLAQLYHYLTKYDDELRLIDDALRLDIHNAQAYFMKGMMFKEKGDTARAISSMQTAVEQDPDHYNAYIQLGLLNAAQHNPIAESYYLNAISINPNSEEAIYNLAMYYQDMQIWNRAIETYTTLLKINPHHFDAHFNLGIIHATKLEVVDEGQRYFSLAISDNPKEPRGYYGLGYCYEKKGDINNARMNYQAALNVDSTYVNAARALAKLEK